MKNRIILYLIAQKEIQLNYQSPNGIQEKSYKMKVKLSFIVYLARVQRYHV